MSSKKKHKNNPSSDAGSNGSGTGDVFSTKDPLAVLATRVSVPADIDPDSDPSQFFNRDLSWLEFNRRVLGQATDERTPLLERVKFLTICASNLDEFFMKRVALLKRRLRSGYEIHAHNGMTVRQQLDAARAMVKELQEMQARCFEDLVLPALRENGIDIAKYADLEPSDRERVDEWFHTNVFPILTPLAVDQGHRFPFISNLSESLGILVSQPGSSDKLFARIKVPDALPRIVSVPPDGGEIGPLRDADQIRLVSLEQIIQHNLDAVFPGMQIVDIMPFRVTRSTGVDLEGEEVEDLLEHVEAELQMRRFASVVRLEVASTPSDPIISLLKEELELDDEDVYVRGGLLEYQDLTDIIALDRPTLKQRPWTGVVPPRLRDEDTDIFSAIREQDVLVHHPYESFAASVERFIAAAAKDPNVLAIKQTLYRTSRDSPFIDSLIRAAEEGKQVACLVELRARFDEDKNVRFARHLEKHGVHVAYGVIGLKTHCKCSLVVRREGDRLRSYAHVGTGNYHPGTAQLYTDCGLLTCDPAICEDVINIFNYLTGRSLNRHYNKLLIAPVTMRERFYELIDREVQNARAGKPARVVAKMNQLEDVGIIKRLYEASQAGVKITCIVRGFCCLRPGVPGLSENIRIVSVVGRFLEHARIFHFACGREDPVDGEWYIGSGDWMSRNLNNRVEAVTPVEDRDARRKLSDILLAGVHDRRHAWELDSNGKYALLKPGPDDPEDSMARLGTFETLCRAALESSRAVRSAGYLF